MSGFLHGLVARAAGRAAEAPARPRRAPRFLPDDVGLDIGGAVPHGAGRPPVDSGATPPHPRPPGDAATDTRPRRRADAKIPPAGNVDRIVSDARAKPHRPELARSPRAEADAPERPQMTRATRGNPAEPLAVVRANTLSSDTPAASARAASPRRSAATQADGSRDTAPEPAVRAVPVLRTEPQLALRALPEPRIEVHIGRVELRSARPPQPPPRPASPAPGQRPAQVRGFDRLATARRYLDRTAR